MAFEEEIYYVLGFEPNPILVSNSLHNAHVAYSIKSELDFINGSFEKMNFNKK
jgi:hypothetical protein